MPPKPSMYRSQKPVRSCERCGAYLSSHNEGERCFACLVDAFKDPPGLEELRPDVTNLPNGAVRSLVATHG